MANILYGVNGEGSGHSTRATEAITHLERAGHTVHVASFDRGLQNLRTKFEVMEIHGFRLAYLNNRVRYRRTVLKNLIAAPKAARSIRSLLRRVEEWQIHLVITDFEPLSCHVGHRKRLPVISVDNQHILTNTDISYPANARRDAAAAKLVSRFMTPRADAYLVTSFVPARVRRRNTFLVPPILRRELLEARPTEGSHILVYVTSPSPELLRLLERIPSPFLVYGFGREDSVRNLRFKLPDTSGFLKDLASAKAVIANSGFSLLTESLHLAKPYLAVPVKNQFEQILNAWHLARSGYGAYWEDLTKEKIESFLCDLPVFRKNLARYPRQDNSRFFSILDSLIAQYVSAGAGAAHA